MAEPDPKTLADTAMRVQLEWFTPPPPRIPHGWSVYTLEFVLATLQGYVAEPHRIVRTLPWMILGRVVLVVMGLAQALLMLLAWIPITSSLLEIVARTFTRNAVGFFLRACYWKAKLRHLGQDTIIDQNVDIWGPAAVSIGYHCHIDTNVRLAAGERRHRQHGYITIGNFVHLGPGVHIAGRGGVEVGNYVGIMANAHLYSATGVVEWPDDPGQLISMSHMAPYDQQHIIEGVIFIEDFAFLGMMSRVMPNVRIGQGAVIHANCEVVRDVPSYANIGGIHRGRQIGWRRPRRRSAHWIPIAALDGAPLAPATITEIRALISEDILDRVIDLHFEAFPDGVTTQLGREFVQSYYQAMVGDGGASLWVAKRFGRVCGFMGCSTDRRIFEKAHRSGITRALALWRFLTLRLTLVAILRALRKRRLSKEFPDHAELLSIVVAKSERRSGLGKQFLDIWMKKLRDSNLSSYIVFTDNPEGIKFYEKYKGDCLFKFQLGALWSACYRFKVSQSGAELSDRGQESSASEPGPSLIRAPDPGHVEIRRDA